MPVANPSSSGWRVSKEIPLPWIVAIVASLIGQAVAVYVSQEKQAHSIGVQSEAIRDLSQQVRAISIQLSGKDGKDIEHDARLNELFRRDAEFDRRLTSIESKPR